MFERQVEEDPLHFRHGLVLFQGEAVLAEEEGEAVLFEGAGIVAVEVPAELVEHDDDGKALARAAGGPVLRRRQVRQRLQQRAEAFADLRVGLFRFAEPELVLFPRRIR
jgi:hypothetical protein